MVEVYGMKGEDTNDGFALFTSQRMPAEIIRECNRNSTFYSMFGMEDKFKFLAEGGPGDEYEQLKLRIREMARIRLPQNQEFGARMLYDSEKAEVLGKLGKITVPTIEDSVIQKVCNSRKLLKHPACSGPFSTESSRPRTCHAFPTQATRGEIVGFRARGRECGQPPEQHKGRIASAGRFHQRPRAALGVFEKESRRDEVQHRRDLFEAATR